jgi:hypothetical protein
VIHHILSTCGLCKDPALVFSLWNADFHLWLTQAQLNYCKEHSLVSCPAEVDMLMTMLRVTIDLITSLARHGYDISSREREYENLRNSLDLLLQQHTEKVVNSYKLRICELAVDLNSDAGPRDTVVPFSLEISNQFLDATTATDLNGLRLQANENLGKWRTLPLHTHLSLSALQSWVNSQKSKKACYPLILQTVKHVVFHIFLAMVNQPNDTSILEYVTLEALAPILQAVREISKSFSEPTTVIELKSSSLLISWVMVCLAYERIARDLDGSQQSPAPGFIFKNNKQYGPCLDPSHLQHLILRSKFDEEVALILAAYLKSKQGSLFSFSEQNVSITLATEYAQASPSFRAKLLNERRYAQALIDEHWNAVQIKQRRVEKIKSTISSLKQELSTAEANKWGQSYKSYMYYQYTEQISSIQSRITSQERDLADASKPPERVRQRIPENDAKALAVLFFLFMPSEFSVLSHLTCVANLMLLPYDCSQTWFDWPEMNGENCSKWQGYYQKSCNYGNDRPSTAIGPVFLCFTKSLPTLKSMTDNVMWINSKSFDIWYPDSSYYDTLDLKLAWDGANYAPDVKGLIYNPFKVHPIAAISRGFTGNLREPKLQQYLNLCFSNIEARGNLGIASQAEKPLYLRKSEFLHFAGLRSYPNRQFRALMSVLREEQLPLQLPDVKTLIRHALYQLGEISFVNGRPFLDWRTDLYNDSGAIHAFSETLVKRLDAVREAVANRETLILLGELCAFVDDRMNSQSKLVLLCSDIPFTWAKRLNESLYSVEERPAMRFTKCIYYLYSIACFNTVQLLSPELYAERIIELNILINDLSVFAEEVLTRSSEKLRAEYTELQSIRQEVLAKHYHLIAEECSKNPGMLNGMIEKVIESVPEGLCWKRIGARLNTEIWENLCCFEAVHEGDLFSVNIYNGIILKNGLPPSRLVCLTSKFYFNT